MLSYTKFFKQNEGLYSTKHFSVSMQHTKTLFLKLLFDYMKCPQGQGKQIQGVNGVIKALECLIMGANAEGIKARILLLCILIPLLLILPIQSRISARNSCSDLDKKMHHYTSLNREQCAITFLSHYSNSFLENWKD